MIEDDKKSAHIEEVTTDELDEDALDTVSGGGNVPHPVVPTGKGG